MPRTLDQTKRAAILAAAKDVFNNDGYATAKMSDIAAGAGVAIGTLYLYFESKEAIASAIGEDLFARLVAQFGSIVQRIEDPEGIETLIAWALNVSQRDRDVLAMVKERNQDLNSKKKGRQRFVAQLADALSNLMSKGVIRQYDDTNTLAELILALMRRIIMSSAIFQDETTDELSASAVMVLQHALFDDVTLRAYHLVKRKQQQGEV